MQKNITLRGMAVLLLICMLVPFAPTLVEMLATGVQAATTLDNILIYDDFQMGTDADYAYAGNANYTATLRNGQLIISTEDATASTTSNVNGAYLLPYAAITAYNKLTVSFEFTILNADSPTGMPSLWLCYGATDALTYGLSGIRVNDTREFAGKRTTHATNPQGAIQVITRTHYLQENTKTTYEYLTAGTHTMTVQLTAGGVPRMYIDGLRYLAGGAEGWSTNTSYAAQASLAGLFGFDLWQKGQSIAIDNFLVYEGHGNLTTTPVSTVATPAGPKHVMIYDDFNDPYAYDYADASKVWGLGGTTSKVENGALVLDAVNGNGIYHDYYPLPYKVPDGTTAYTVEMEITMLQSASGKEGSFNYYHRADLMMTYGNDGSGSDSRIYFSGLRLGDANHKSNYNYDQAHTQFWGVLSDNRTFNRAYRTLPDAAVLGNGLQDNATYTLVVQVQSSGAYAYIKEVADATAPAAWYDWDGGTTVTSPTADHSGITGYIGFYTGRLSKMAIESVTIYEGIYTPHVASDITEYIYDDFMDLGANQYQNVTNAKGDTAAPVVVTPTGKVSTGAILFNRSKSTGERLYHKLPHTLPAATKSFVAEVQFRLDLTGATMGTTDIWFSFGDWGNGHFNAGFRLTETSCNEFIQYTTADNRQLFRYYRSISGGINLTDIKNAGKDAIFILRVEVTEDTVFSSILKPTNINNSNTLENSTVTKYTGEPSYWSQDTNSHGSSGDASAEYVNYKGGSAFVAPTWSGAAHTYFNFRKGGNIGFQTDSGALNSKLYYESVRVAYTHTKGILPHGTTLYYEDFSDQSAADAYNQTSTPYTATVEGGVLKLTVGSGCTDEAYPLPITIGKDVDSFTVKIRISIENYMGTTSVGASGGSNVPAVDMMLMYGASSAKNSDGNLFYGYLSGMRLNTTTDFTALLQNEPRRAYRGYPSDQVKFGYNREHEGNQVSPENGTFYTMVVEVKNGRSTCYVEGFAKNALYLNQTETLKDGNAYASGSVDEQNCMTDNLGKYSIAYTSTDASGNTNILSYYIDDFANRLDGQLGFYSGYRETLWIDSISVVSGIATTVETKKVADGTVLYENNFNNANIDDYLGQAGYTATLVDGALKLNKSTSDYNLFELPGSHVSGAKAMTVSFNFKANKVSENKSTIALGYGAASDGENYRYVGWRQGAAYNAVEEYGYAINSTNVQSRSRYWLKKINKLSPMETFGSKADYDAGSTAVQNYCEYWAFLQDGGWHEMTLVITAEKAIMYIDGNRLLYQVTNAGAIAGSASEATFSTEHYASNSQMANIPAYSGGSLGILLSVAGEEVLIDNFLCVAGTGAYASGGFTFSESFAGQATLTDAQIDGVRDPVYDRSGKLYAYDFAYKQADHGIPDATTEVLWDMGYLYFYTTVSDRSNNNSIDAVTYYIGEDGSIDYQGSAGAYTLTVYRDGRYLIGNERAAKGAIVKVVNTSSVGYVVEAKIPLLTKGVQTLSAGTDIGFNYVVKDQNGWIAWTPGHGNFTTSPDALDRLSLVFTASPTGDTTVLWPYFLFGGIALVGIVGAAWVLGRKKNRKNR